MRIEVHVHTKYSKDSCSFRVMESDHKSFWRGLEKGEWEPYTFEVFDRFVTKDTYFFDVGAWIGPTTLYAAQKAKRVYSFEPDPVAFNELKENVKANPRFENIIIHNVCVGTSEGTMHLGMHEKAGDSESSILFSNSATTWEVCSIRLDKFIQKLEIQGPIFIKMDIEGYEYTLLPKIINLLNNNVVLYVSLHPQHIAYKKISGHMIKDRIIRRFLMFLSFIRIAWVFRKLQIYDCYNNKINLWLRAYRILLPRQKYITPDNSIVVLGKRRKGLALNIN